MLRLVPRLHPSRQRSGAGDRGRSEKFMSDNAIKEMSDVIGLLIELKCENCHNEFSEFTGKTEADVWSWADATAQSALLKGWVMTESGFRCPDCRDENK